MIGVFIGVSWLVQLLVGLGLFVISFLIEYRVLQAFLLDPRMALVATLALEVGKAAAIVWHRYLRLVNPSYYPVIVRFFSGAFRIGLVALSLLCTLLFLAKHLDRPNLQPVREAELAGIQARLDADLRNIEQIQIQRRTELTARHETAYADLNAMHRQRVGELESMLSREMDNVVGGVFKGSRYQEIERRLEAAKTEQATALADLSARQLEERSRLEIGLQQGQGNQRQAAIDTAEHARKNVLADNYATDERVNEPHVAALVNLVSEVFHRSLAPLSFVFAFSLLLSVLIELGILLAFEFVTLALIPKLAARQAFSYAKAGLEADTATQTKAERKRHREAVDRVMKTANAVVEEARRQAGRHPASSVQ